MEVLMSDPMPIFVSSRPVRVVVPAKVAFNLAQMNKLTAEILARLGCPGCHSGHDIRFDIASEFLVDENLGIHEASERFGR
jgi:hypothetical protein